MQHYNWRAALCYYRFNSAHSFLLHSFEGRRSIFLNSSLNLTESISGSEAILPAQVIAELPDILMDRITTAIYCQ